MIGLNIKRERERKIFSLLFLDLLYFEKQQQQQQLK
jgi:hypothetical protein